MVGANLMAVGKGSLANSQSVVLLAKTLREAFLKEAFGEVVAQVLNFVITSDRRSTKMLFIFHLSSHPFDDTHRTPGSPWPIHTVPTESSPLRHSQSVNWITATGRYVAGHLLEAPSLEPQMGENGPY